MRYGKENARARKELWNPFPPGPSAAKTLTVLVQRGGNFIAKPDHYFLDSEVKLNPRDRFNNCYSQESLPAAPASNWLPEPAAWLSAAFSFHYTSALPRACEAPVGLSAGEHETRCHCGLTFLREKKKES